MITKDMLRSGYRAGDVKIIDCADAEGCVCQIGTSWFYFGGQTAAESRSEDYVKNVPEEDIICEIYETLEDFAAIEEFQTEYAYYNAHLLERGHREQMPSVYTQIVEHLPLDSVTSDGKKNRFWRDGPSGYEIICRSEEDCNCIADYLTLCGCDVSTGYYDPVEDEKSGETDYLTGFWYVS